MNYLIDTHVFLWWITDDDRLSMRVRVLLSDSDNDIFISAATGWEISIKYALGRLTLSQEPQTLIPSEIEKNRLTALPIMMTHTLHLSSLPMIHRDPFDRILISQSIIEKTPLITRDPLINKYEVKTVW